MTFLSFHSHFLLEIKKTKSSQVIINQFKRKEVIKKILVGWYLANPFHKIHPTSFRKPFFQFLYDYFNPYIWNFLPFFFFFCLVRSRIWMRDELIVVERISVRLLDSWQVLNLDLKFCWVEEEGKELEEKKFGKKESEGLYLMERWMDEEGVHWSMRLQRLTESKIYFLLIYFILTFFRLLISRPSVSSGRESYTDYCLH